jgi:hypothetical protein
MVHIVQGNEQRRGERRILAHSKVSGKVVMLIYKQRGIGSLPT